MTPVIKPVASAIVWVALAVLLSAWIAVTTAQIVIELKAIERGRHVSDHQ